jgi:hypothetical protein
LSEFNRKKGNLFIEPLVEPVSDQLEYSEEETEHEDIDNRVKE